MWLNESPAGYSTHQAGGEGEFIIQWYRLDGGVILRHTAIQEQQYQVIQHAGFIERIVVTDKLLDTED